MLGIIVTLTLSISVYTPGANKISGGSKMANGEKPHIGAFACPPSIPLGWRVRVGGKAAKKLTALGLPIDGVCADRFASKYRRHLDVAIPEGYMQMDDGERLKTAFLFGRMTDYVVFTPP